MILPEFPQDLASEETLILVVADLSHFIMIIENKQLGEIFHILDSFYKAVGRELKDTDGKIIKYMGDAVFMTFPPADPANVIEFIKSLKEKLDKLLVKWEINSTLQVKVHIGRVACGMVGLENKREFDVLGAAVNELFMLQKGEFVISSELNKILP